MFLEMPLGTVLRKEIFSRWQGVQLLWKRGGGEEGTRGREEQEEGRNKRKGGKTFSKEDARMVR